MDSSYSVLLIYLLLGIRPILTSKWFISPVRLTRRKVKFSFTSSYQLEIASGLGVGHVPTSSSSRIPYGADPCRLCACCNSLHEFTCMLTNNQQKTKSQHRTCLCASHYGILSPLPRCFNCHRDILVTAACHSFTSPMVGSHGTGF